MRTPSLLQRLISGAVDLVLPPRCLACGTEIDAPLGLCAVCWGELRFLSAPCCRCCGFPLPHTSIEAPLCATCSRQPPSYDRARAALRYDQGSARLILRYKRGGRLEGVPLFARWMHHAGDELLVETDLILPVPLHRWRLLRRGFNQSAMLAKQLSILSDRPWSPGILLRQRATRSQQGLGAAARQENIRSSAFRIRSPDRVAGARILLVDDVLTTGATVSACTAVLRRAGAAAVDVLALARVVRDEAMPI
ncbi:MAG: double zinc ribbon domain-containing protein [Geminicoccaceae bacterium]